MNRDQENYATIGCMVIIIIIIMMTKRDVNLKELFWLEIALFIYISNHFAMLNIQTLPSLHHSQLQPTPKPLDRMLMHASRPLLREASTRPRQSCGQCCPQLKPSANQLLLDWPT